MTCHLFCFRIDNGVFLPALSSIDHRRLWPAPLRGAELSQRGLRLLQQERSERNVLGAAVT